MRGYWILRAANGEMWSRDGWSQWRQPTTFRSEQEARRAIENLQSDREVRPVHIVESE